MTSMDERIMDLHSALRSYGYLVEMEPIEGMEAEYVAGLREGLDKIQACLDLNAERYGYRGRSRNAIAALHADLPEPVWGVIFYADPKPSRKRA